MTFSIQILHWILHSYDQIDLIGSEFNQVIQNPSKMDQNQLKIDQNPSKMDWNPSTSLKIGQHLSKKTKSIDLDGFCNFLSFNQHCRLKMDWNQSKLIKIN